MVNTTQTISISDVLCCRDAMFRVLGDIGHGKISYSGSKPLDVYFINEGKDKGRYIIKDGYHRFFQKLLLKKTTVEVFVEEEGLKEDCLFTIKQEFQIDLAQPYLGLDNLADPEILDDLLSFL